MSLLEVGDRVRWVKSYNMGNKGVEGTIIIIIRDPINILNDTIGVQFDKPISNGHDCSGQGPNYPIYKQKHCWWCEVEDLSFISHGEEIPPVKYLSTKAWASGKLTPINE